MLVLSRKVGETIVVGNDIVITVIEIDRNKIKLGIQAPKSVPVNRKEVHDKVENERRRGEHGTITN